LVSKYFPGLKANSGGSDDSRSMQRGRQLPFSNPSNQVCRRKQSLIISVSQMILDALIPVILEYHFQMSPLPFPWCALPSESSRVMYKQVLQNKATCMCPRHFQFIPFSRPLSCSTIMCYYHLVDFSCKHQRCLVRKWCWKYEDSQIRCPPHITGHELKYYLSSG